MPFPEQQPREVTRQDVELLRPGRLGCYGLFQGDRWIYVGKGDIRERLLAHLNGDNWCIAQHMAGMHWMDVVTTDYDAEEKRLIRELNPLCNQRVG